MKLSDARVEQLTALKHAKDFLSEAEGNTSELTPDLLEALYKRVTSQWFNIDTELLTYEHFSSACGCMGPQDDEPFCNCTMGYLLERFKYDVALLVKERIPT